MVEYIYFVTFPSMMILCVFSYLLIETNYISNIYNRMPRQITWLDMLGSYVMDICLTIFLYGFFEHGRFGSIYSFPVTIMEFAPNSYIGVSSYEYEPLFLANALLGFILCLIFMYCFITILLKISFIDNVPYTDDSTLCILFGFHYKRLTLFIIIAFITSTLLCIDYLVSFVIPELLGNTKTPDFITSVSDISYSANMIIYHIFSYLSIFVTFVFILIPYHILGLELFYNKTFIILFSVGLVYTMIGIRRIIINILKNNISKKYYNYYHKFKKSRIVRYALSYNVNIPIILLFLISIPLTFDPKYSFIFTDYLHIFYMSVPIITMTVVLLQYMLGFIFYTLERILNIQMNIRDSGLDPINYIELVILIAHILFVLTIVIVVH